MLVRAVLFAGCNHETLMLGHWPSKRPRFTTERVECCDHGLYVVCGVAGIIFCCSSFFWPRNGQRKNPAKGNELLRFGVWQIGFSQGFLKDLRPTIWPQQKISRRKK